MLMVQPRITPSEIFGLGAAICKTLSLKRSYCPLESGIKSTPSLVLANIIGEPQGLNLTRPAIRLFAMKDAFSLSCRHIAASAKNLRKTNSNGLFCKATNQPFAHQLVGWKHNADTAHNFTFNRHHKFLVVQIIADRIGIEHCVEVAVGPNTPNVSVEHRAN